jgi:hypothetical protein
MPTGSGGSGDGGGGGSSGGGSGGTPTMGGMPNVPSDGTVCPADASFCADFESADLPEGAAYHRNAAPAEWTADFEVDNTVFREGGGSLRVKTTMEASESAYKMLAVPTPGSAFWVRAYLRSDAVLGQGTLSSSEHNRFMIAASQPEPNSTDALEFAEDCGIALNSHDQVYRPEGGNATCDSPLRLEPDTWYCVEVSFDGATGNTQVYIDGELQIDAAGWEPGQGNFTHLKFGVDNLHTIVRNVWYDAVAVGPTRPGCL